MAQEIPGLNLLLYWGLNIFTRKNLFFELRVELSMLIIIVQNRFKHFFKFPHVVETSLPWIFLQIFPLSVALVFVFL